MSRYDTKHIREVKDPAQVMQLACHHYIRARKAEDKRDEVIRKNVELSEKIIELQAKLGAISEIIDAGV